MAISDTPPCAATIKRALSEMTSYAYADAECAHENDKRAQRIASRVMMVCRLIVRNDGKVAALLARLAKENPKK